MSPTLQADSLPAEPPGKPDIEKLFVNYPTESWQGFFFPFEYVKTV